MSRPILAPFVMDPRGRVYVAADGPEVYAWSGVDDSPLWKDFFDGIIVGIGISGDHVHGVDTDGRVVTWRVFDGERVDVRPQDRRVHGFYADPHGGLALRTDAGVRLLAPNGLVADGAVAKASVVARDSTGVRVLVGTEAGELVWLDALGNRTGSISAGAPVRAVAWSAHACWVVAAGTRLLVLAADPPTAVQGAVQASPVLATYDVGGTISAIAVSSDGWLLAAAVGDRVVVVTRTDGSKLSTIQYKRPVGAVGFGADTWLAVCLEHADVNRIELATGRLTKNSPGLGRHSDPWGASVEMNAAEVRGALARARAGGAPVAMQVNRPKPGEAADTGRPWWVYALVALAFFFVCLGCATSGGVTAWFLRG
jgi:hypothetical protein